MHDRLLSKQVRGVSRDYLSQLQIAEQNLWAVQLLLGARANR